MKTILRYSCLFFLFGACKTPVKTNTEVIVRLNGTGVQEASLTSMDTTFKVPADSKGNLFFKFKSNKAQTYQLEFNDKLDLFLIPGDSLTINKNGDGYIVSGGESAVLSNYYIIWKKHLENVFRSFDESKYYSLESKEFTRTVFTYLDSIRAPLLALSKKRANLNPEFLRLEQERLKYYVFIDFLSYAGGMHKKFTGTDPVIDLPFHNYLKDVNLNDSSLLELDQYKEFIVSYAANIGAKEFMSDSSAPKDKYSESSFMLNFILHEFTNQKVLDYVLYKVMYSRVNEFQLEEKTLTGFKEHCKNQAYIKDVDERFRELRTIMPGTQAPDFTLYDFNDKARKLSDFRGKYVLLDFWGVTCGICMKEFPYLKQIEEDYMGLNIVFVGICIENNQELMRKKVKSLDLKGIQLITKLDLNSPLLKDYKINHTPVYMLIDKDGTIVDPRAPYPSQNLKNLLEKTVSEKS
jgi:peroxiredoxin